MTLPFLMQSVSQERLDALQRHLNRQGTVQGVLLTLLGLAAFVALVLVIHALQARAHGGDVDRPGKLFRRLVCGLNLTVPQRDLLLRIGRDLHLQSPTVLLLGRRIFETHTERWMANPPVRGGDDRQRVADLADVLFSGVQRRATSTSSGEAAAPGASG